MTVMEQLGIDLMSVPERIALARDILDSVADDRPLPPLSEAKKRELDRRMAEAKANPGDNVPWEEVDAGLRKRLGL